MMGPWRESPIVESSCQDGLFQHYWILAKFVLTVGAIVILLLHMPTVSRIPTLAAEMRLSNADSGTLQLQLLVHAAGGLLVLLTVTTLSVYKGLG